MMDAQPPATQAPARPPAVWLPLLTTLLLSFSFSTFPRLPFALDDALSEKAVLSYAHEHGLQFGTDIVFTYGPLGFLTSRYFFSHAAGVRMLIDLVQCFVVAAGVCLVAWRMALWWRFLFLGVFLLAAANIDPRADLVLDIGLLAWGLLCLVESGRLLVFSMIAFALVVVFSLLVKASFFLSAGLSAAIIICDLLGRRKFSAALGLAAGLTAGIALAWILSGQNLTHLGPHLLNAVPIIKGYDQTVGVDGLSALRTRGFLTASLAPITVLLYACGAYDAVNRPIWRRLLLGGWLSALLFMVFKHGYVRADLYHLGFFFGFVPVLALALEVLPTASGRFRLCSRGFALACCAVSLFTLQFFFAPSLPAFLSRPFRAVAENVAALLRPGAYQIKMIETEAEARHASKLPRIAAIVGRSTIDVFGQNQAYAIFNGLNYRPRPVFQSYLAYDAPLMRLNEEFFRSAAAPEFVLFGLNPIDRKFPPLEDSWLLRHLLINYRFVAEESPFLLLKQRSSTGPQLKLLQQGAVAAHQPIPLNAFGDVNLWLEIELKPTLLGGAEKFLYKPPKVRLGVVDPSRPKPLRFPAPIPMLAAGFLASPLVLRSEDVLALYSGKPLGRPVAYSVEISEGDENLWQKEIRFRLYQIENQLGRPAPAPVPDPP